MMFLQVPPVAEIRMTTIFDEPMFTTDDPKEDGGTPKRIPWTMRFDRFLLERTTDPKFYEHGSKKEGVEAVELVMLARTAIKAGPDRGCYLFEDEVGKRLKEVCLRPGASHAYSPQLHHNFAAWLKTVAAMSDKDPRAVLVQDAPPKEDLPAP